MRRGEVLEQNGAHRRRKDKPPQHCELKQTERTTMESRVAVVMGAIGIDRTHTHTDGFIHTNLARKQRTTCTRRTTPTPLNTTPPSTTLPTPSPALLSRLHRSQRRPLLHLHTRPQRSAQASLHADGLLHLIHSITTTTSSHTHACVRSPINHLRFLCLLASQLYSNKSAVSHNKLLCSILTILNVENGTSHWCSRAAC